MTSLPLLLENYFFTKVIVEANPAYEPEKDQGEPVGVHREVQIGRHKDDPRRWRVNLSLRTEFADEKKIPYKINLECAGFFTVSPDVEETQVTYLVRANGGAILYSSAREFLLLITGRGPWNGFYLPTTIFFETAKEEEEVEPAPFAPKASKKNRVSRVKKIIDQFEGVKYES
jgi:preprotein translocase subunit SecB